MVTNELKKSIDQAFKNVIYPADDGYYKAVEKKEYCEPPYSTKEKKWFEITLSDMKKHYDFCYFLEDNGFLYYAQFYLNFLLDNSKDDSELLADSFLLSLKKRPLNIFNIQQLSIINDVLVYCNKELKLYEDDEDYSLVIEKLNDVIDSDFKA